MADVDDELMIRFQRDGDHEAFAQLFLRQKDGLLRFLQRLVRDRAAADDLSQQAWLRVVEVARRGGYLPRPDVAFRTWLFTVARNLAIDKYKRRCTSIRMVPYEEDALDQPTADDPAENASLGQLARLLDAAVLRLPCEQQRVINLWAAGNEPASIAVMLSAPRETVLSRKKYALAKLRVALSDLAPALRQA